MQEKNHNTNEQMRKKISILYNRKAYKTQVQEGIHQIYYNEYLMDVITFFFYLNNPSNDLNGVDQIRSMFLFFPKQKFGVN